MQEIITCSACKASYDKNEKLEVGFRTRFTVGSLSFCRATCVLAHINENGLEPFSHVSHAQAFSQEDWGDAPTYWKWDHHGCTNCRVEDRSVQLITITAPFDSTFPDEPLAVACSKACLVALFQKEAAWQDENHIGQWGDPTD